MKKRYWLKGLVIIPALYLIVIFLVRPYDDMGILTSLLSPGTWIIIGVGGLDASTKYLTQFIISIFSWAVIGVLIGWIYGKIKNRNVDKNMV